METPWSVHFSKGQVKGHWGQRSNVCFFTLWTVCSCNEYHELVPGQLKGHLYCQSLQTPRRADECARHNSQPGPWRYINV